MSTDANTVITKVKTSPGTYDKETNSAAGLDNLTDIPYGNYTVVVVNEITK